MTAILTTIWMRALRYLFVGVLLVGFVIISVVFRILQEPLELVKVVSFESLARRGKRAATAGAAVQRVGNSSGSDTHA